MTNYSETPEAIRRTDQYRRMRDALQHLSDDVLRGSGPALVNGPVGALALADEVEDRTRVWVETQYANPSSVERESYPNRAMAERVVSNRLRALSDDWDVRQVVSCRIV